VRLDGDVLRLQAAGRIWVDVEQFETASRAAAASRDVAALERALDLYRGDLLPEDRHVDWTAPRREALRDRYVNLLSQFGRLLEERGDLGGAVRAFERLVSCEPAHEEAHTTLMRLYAAAGQRHRALRQYRLLEKALIRELDAQPDPASRKLRTAILVGQFPGSTTPAAASPPVPPFEAEVTVTGREEQVAGMVAR
jgi:DNA-binding SARP family transcriptional activator